MYFLENTSKMNIQNVYFVEKGLKGSLPFNVSTLLETGLQGKFSFFRGEMNIHR